MGKSNVKIGEDFNRGIVKKHIKNLEKLLKEKPPIVYTGAQSKGVTTYLSDFVKK